MVEIRVTGLDAVIAGLPKQPETLTALDRLADKVLYAVQKYAKQRSPVLTGTLRRSIYTRRGGVASGYTSTNTDYAVYVHEGLGSNRHKGRRPFMQEGYQDVEDKELDALVNNMLDRLLK